MKANEQPIPLRSIVCLPRWLMLACTITSGVFIAVGFAMLVYAIGWTSGGQMGGWIGGAIGCIGGGAGGLFGTLKDWTRRMPATLFLRHINNDRPNPFYARVFKPAVLALLIGITLGVIYNHRAIWHGIVQTSAILAFIGGSIEAARRHTTRQAKAVFALYADGALEDEDTAAIDDSRQKDEAFDTDVREYLAIGEQLRAFAAGEPSGSR